MRKPPDIHVDCMDMDDRSFRLSKIKITLLDFLRFGSSRYTNHMSSLQKATCTTNEPAIYHDANSDTST